MHADAPLTDWLVHTAAKGMAVLVVALIAGLALRKLAAARRYAVWITAVVALALLPLATGLLPAWHVLLRTTPEVNGPVLVPETPVEAPVESVETAEPEAPVAVSRQTPVRMEVPPPSRFVFFWEKLVEWLPVVWFSMATLLLVRLAWSAWRLAAGAPFEDRNLRRVVLSRPADRFTPRSEASRGRRERGADGLGRLAAAIAAAGRV